MRIAIKAPIPIFLSSEVLLRNGFSSLLRLRSCMRKFISTHLVKLIAAAVLLLLIVMFWALPVS